MSLVLLVLVVSLAVGWLAGGRLANLAHVELRATWLVFLAVAAQLVLAGVAALGVPGELVARPLLGASHLALLGFIAANRYRPGMLLVLVGLALNAVVSLANGGMPVAGEALVALGGQAAVEPGKHQLLTEATHLPWLADVIPVPFLRSVLSVGDLLLAAGVGILVVAQMRRFPPRPGRRLRPRPVPPLSRRARERRRAEEQPRSEP
jgi:hypothetical protein